MKASTDLASARARLAWAEQVHCQRVDRAHRELNALLTPARGEQLAELGPLSLYEQELHIGTENTVSASARQEVDTIATEHREDTRMETAGRRRPIKVP
ncbi:hypothetical protein [Streptomyces sp. ERV7]|uniref:hypothetical protein n=1 Tax=Streptomyces sp. ERV7 TaxID=1322334 RepID=UPI000AAE1307|nr:hypothetical protein [Streptomyces sp. ERV7]